MVEMTDVLQSYELDFQQHLEQLQNMTNETTADSSESATQVAIMNLEQMFTSCQDLLKQIEVEGYNHMADDTIRKRIQKHKQSFDAMRRQVRKFQQERDRLSLVSSGETDLERATGQQKQLLNNRRLLEEAKQTGYEMEDMAGDIKYNLRQQSDQLQNSTMKNLFNMQKDLVQGSKIIKLIGNERRKNKFVIYGVMSFLMFTLGVAVYYTIF